MANPDDNIGSSSLDTGDIVAIVALIISIIAFVATFLQVLQQYFASATGYAKCDYKVIEEWSKFRKRILRIYELRFEVQYEAPVVFLAPAYNTNKPLPDRELWVLEGTPASYAQTRLLLPQEARARRESLPTRELIHTADNERATWLELLVAVQRMERDSAAWHTALLQRTLETRKTQPFNERTLAVSVQPKVKSWDTMPASLGKPYATTTMCHIIELAGILGLHWKEFSRDTDKYRAEGNGYILTGSSVIDLGLVFYFQKSGKTRFEENRVIPADEVKQLCFGFIPTIFCRPDDEDHLKYPFDEPKDFTALQLGSGREIAETLLVIGCNSITANYFLDDDKKQSHLFPVAFEVLGMLGRTIHVYGSAFRMLPNPTIFHWDKKSFSMWKLLRAFRKLILDPEVHQTDQVSTIQKKLEQIFKARENRSETDFTVEILDSLHEALDVCDKYLTEQYVTNDQILYVLRGHLQGVLAHINGSSETDDNLFDVLNVEAPEHKQSKFMHIYFDTIRTQVIREALDRRRTTFHPTVSPSSVISQSTTQSGDSPVAGPGTVAPAVPGLVHTQTGFDEDEKKFNNIWCTLVFRMLCWLLLHDFHKKDVQVSKSELLGSRLPVFIA